MASPTPKLVSVTNSNALVQKPPQLSAEEESLIEILREFRYPGADTFLNKWRAGETPGTLFDILRQEIKPLHELFKDMENLQLRFEELSAKDTTGLLVAEFRARLNQMVRK